MSLRSVLLPLAFAAAAFAQSDGTDADFIRQAREAQTAIDAGRKQALDDKAAAQGVQDEGLARVMAQAVKNGCNFLSVHQRQDGSWGGLFVRKKLEELYGRVAITALAVETIQGLCPDARDGKKAVERGTRFVLENGLKDEVEVEPVPENVAWINYRPYALAYGLAFTSQRPELKDGKARPYRDLFIDKIEHLRKDGRLGYASPKGKKAYESTKGGPSSFQYALLLLSLADAKAPGELIGDFARDLEKMRSPDGRFSYSSDSPGSAAGSVGRDLLCEVALLRAGRSDLAAVEKRLKSFLTYHEDIRRHFKGRGFTSPHSGPGGISDYYDLFGVHAAALAFGLVKTDDVKKQALHLNGAWYLAEDTLKFQKSNGGWEDSAYGGPNYGTSVAMLSLAKLEAFVRSHPRPVTKRADPVVQR